MYISNQTTTSKTDCDCVCNVFRNLMFFLRSKFYVLAGIDSQIKFTIRPLPGDDAFKQWKDAMRAVARLPQGLPSEFRKKVSASRAKHPARS